MGRKINLRMSESLYLSECESDNLLHAMREYNSNISRLIDAYCASTSLRAAAPRTSYQDRARSGHRQTAATAAAAAAAAAAEQERPWNTFIASLPLFRNARVHTNRGFNRETAQRIPTFAEINAALEDTQYASTTHPPGADTVCPISLENFSEGVLISRIRGCGHFFKPACIRRWLARHAFCPTCRHDILSHTTPVVAAGAATVATPIINDSSSAYAAQVDSSASLLTTFASLPVRDPQNLQSVVDDGDATSTPPPLVEIEIDDETSVQNVISALLRLSSPPPEGRAGAEARNNAGTNDVGVDDNLMDVDISVHVSYDDDDDDI